MSKLYTEEQVKQMIEKSRETGLIAEYLILTTPSIELPTDEETYKELREEICNILNLLVMHYGYSTDEAADDILELIKPTNKVGE